MIGIIGGIGPAAGVDLMDKIVSAEDGKLDYDRVPILLYSDTKAIADRNAFLLERSNINPAHGLFDVVEKLSRLSVNVVAIACNAAHSSSIFSVLQNLVEESELDIQVLHLIELLAERINRTTKYRRIGVLSVEGTYRARPYNESFKKFGIEVLTLPDLLVTQMHDVIWNTEYGVKAHSDPTHPDARVRANEVMDHLVNSGADAIFLGCTEYPILIANPEYRGIPILDTNRLFAELIIESHEKK